MRANQFEAPGMKQDGARSVERARRKVLTEGGGTLGDTVEGRIEGLSREEKTMSGEKAAKLKLPRLGQLGIVTRDLEATMTYYRDVFGIGPWAVFEGGPESCVDRGREVSFRGKMAMARAGSVQIELIEIIDPEVDTVHTEFIKSGREGLHHVGFFVRDLDRRLEAARSAGIEVLQHGVLRQLGLVIEYAYLDTVATGGVIIEYIQPRFLGMPFPMRSPLLRWGARLGEKLAGKETSHAGVQ